MKKVLLLAAALLIVASSASAQEDGWLDLFADSVAADGHIPLPTNVCLYPPAIQYYPINIYLIARPPADGLRATECRIEMPDPCGQLVSEVLHPNVNLDMGTWPAGRSLSFNTCMNSGAITVAKLQYLSLTCAWSAGCQTVVLGPHLGSGLLGGATCEAGYPPFTAAHCCDIYLNCTGPDYICSPTAVKEESWGAIKSLYK